MSRYRIQKTKQGNKIQVKTASILLFVNDYIDFWSYIFSYLFWIDVYTKHINNTQEEELKSYIQEMENKVEEDKKEIKEYFSGDNVIDTIYIDPKDNKKK
jgi:hypothetical protein